MTSRFLARIEPVLVLGLTGKFLYLSATHRASLYVHPRLIWIVTLGWLLLACAASAAVFASHPPGRKRGLVITECLVLTLLIAMPIQALSVNRTSALMITSSRQTKIILPADTSKFSFEDWYRYKISGTPSPDLEGKTFHASGIVTERHEGAFELSRVAITCCTADAFRISFPVIASANVPLPAADAWVAIEGIWHHDDERWIISATSLKTIPVPSEPYVYP